MNISRVISFLFLLLLVSPAVLASGQISGFVRSESGRGLANITVFLAYSGVQKEQLTDAFGRYEFSALDSGDYQLIVEDKNFINYTDDDPYPDEGAIYLKYIQANAISLQTNQSLNVGDVILQRVESSDLRQSNATVTDCENYGDDQSPATLFYALQNARAIIIECSGALQVPEIVISKDVKISATSGVTFEGRGDNRILRVLPGILVEIDGIDFTGGRFNTGSAVYNAGLTTITDADITRNTGDTAVVLNAGILNLRQVLLSSNTITYDSVFRNSGVISGHDVTIESHVASAGPVITNQGTIELQQCSIAGLGTNNVFAVNNNAGSIFKLFDCSLTNSSSLFSNEGTLEIYDSSIDSNQGDQSLIESSGVLKIGGTGITNNDVYGLVVYNSGLTEILNSTISTNSAGFSLPGTTTNQDDYRGVIANEGLMRVSSSTIARNTHRGFTDRQIGNAGELQLSNAIVAGTGRGEECGGVSPVTSQGYNLHTDGSCGAALQSDIPFGNPALEELADNGGLGKTHALQTGSDAVNAGNCNNGSLAKDQRGVTRPQGSACDIGAFELALSDAENTDDSDNGADSGNGTDPGNGSGNGNAPTEDNDSTNNAGDSGVPSDDATNSTDNQDGSGAFDANLLQLIVFIVLLFHRRRACLIKLLTADIKKELK